MDLTSPVAGVSKWESWQRQALPPGAPSSPAPRAGRHSADLEARADLEDGAHDREGDEPDEDEHAGQDAARDHLGEEVQLARDQLLVALGDVLEAGDHVARVLADGDPVEDELGEAPRAAEGGREHLALHDPRDRDV